MIDKEIHFIFDKTPKAMSFKKFILKKYKNTSLIKSRIIVVVGGDGFMLQTLKKYQKHNKPFYGINKGTFGFLMNKFKKENFQKNIFNSKPITISALSMKVFTKNNSIKSAIAINEVSLLRQSRQAAFLKIISGKKIITKKLICDGVLISTPAGSTAYNLSIHGPILPLNSKKLAITPISPFRPRRWKGKIISSSSKVKIYNLNIKKRPVSVVADNIEIRNIKSVSVNINSKIKFKLLYDKNNTLTKKIILEKIRKEATKNL